MSSEEREHFRRSPAVAWLTSRCWSDSLTTGSTSSPSMAGVGLEAASVSPCFQSHFPTQEAGLGEGDLHLAPPKSTVLSHEVHIAVAQCRAGDDDRRFPHFAWLFGLAVHPRGSAGGACRGAPSRRACQRQPPVGLCECAGRVVRASSSPALPTRPEIHRCPTA